MSRTSQTISAGLYREAQTVRRSYAELGMVVLLLACLAGCASAPPPQPPLAAPKVNPALLQTPVPPPGPNMAQELPSGSLCKQGNSSLFQDIKAVKVGDIITITVNEAATGSSQASTQTNRNKNFQGNFTFAGAGLGDTGAGSVGKPNSPVAFGPYKGAFSSGFTGTGATSRTDSMTAYMTASVVDVMPNGNLIIRGSRWTKVNDEMQQIILEGVIRPMDVTRNNTVLSQNIAEAKIFLVGKGPVAQHQKPGWVLQLMDLISPF